MIIMFILVKFETNPKVYTDVTRYLLQTYAFHKNYRKVY